MSDPIERARALGGTDEAIALYRDWASTYDHDVFTVGRITGSARIAELATTFVDDCDVRVLDIGCGTGAVGRHLAAAGFRHIDGIDISPEMLALADESGVYRSLRVLNLNEPPFDLDRYDLLISAGTFTSGHVGADVVPELLAALAPGGLIAWSIGERMWQGFERILVTSDLVVLHEALEPVREAGVPESVMFVGRQPLG